MNHADTLHPYIATLCQDLQLSFPHVYANVYVTPISTQTVPAHADDRDVFILQVLGCKLWTVYTNIPIPFPYPQEQVGKSASLPVPESVRRGPILFQSVLQPGDVLYIPRGYVHEAQCVPSTSSSGPDTTAGNTPHPSFGSFHITIAIATHDWSLLGILQNATSDILSSTQLIPIHYRKAIDRQFGQTPTLSELSPSQPLLQQQQQEPEPSSFTIFTTGTTESIIGSNHDSDPSTVSNEAVMQLQQQIDTVLQILRQEITVSNINQALYNKYTFHNQRALQQRNHMMQQYVTKQQHRKDAATLIRNDDLLTRIGYDASRTMTVQTFIRAVTDREKKILTTTHQHHLQQRQSGLHVRAEIYEDIMTILQKVKNSATANQPTAYQVYQLRSLLFNDEDDETGNDAVGGDCVHIICDMTLLSMARRCVELGAFAIVPVPLETS